ncbi:hypothetical protein MSMEI_4551 [Mycolicibacterium smegmatis MC2 155]|uniref:Uncharacterized protein n=1 Tax=Mycolicibacterium smegmatis (strain ATCC 700084 / mc(2)155) TaxID=246196 RepID=I7FI02_MYCS2|nr:hypothetical protein MSMEI_4551 [Mycolicibacterium smegmatis MC2 155]
MICKVRRESIVADHGPRGLGGFVEIRWRLQVEAPPDLFSGQPLSS